ncbi:FliM/FliN family flagellar motor switch protein [Tabrizicola soli]|uniref:FliM/FliN family flagellar motor switch protein n=1 Tax=Tabrizicola soli TaxID=2185115 RepID=A0ABV7DX23_9RHOB|nr:flagellar motor switch protein FliM [Tabrizicola soli]
MTDVIRRKIDRARPAQAEGAPGADRGWRLALARAARDAMGLELDFTRMSIGRYSLAELPELAPDRVLVALLDGPRGALGVLMLGPEVTSTLIEMQTLGRLTATPAAARKPTRIDAAMVAGLIDRALAGLDEALMEEADLAWAGGFRYASFLEEVRPLGLMLEDEAYRVLSAEVSLGGGRRSGQVLLVLPAQGRGERPATLAPAAEGEAPLFSAALSAQVMAADCRLDAVIGRMTLPIRQIMALRAGDVLPMLQASVDSVGLETMAGRKVASGRLGQHRGMRALKLSDTADLAADPPFPAQGGPMVQDLSPLAGPGEPLRAAG